MGQPSYIQFVVDQNVVMQRIPVRFRELTIISNELSDTYPKF